MTYKLKYVEHTESKILEATLEDPPVYGLAPTFESEEFEFSSMTQLLNQVKLVIANPGRQFDITITKVGDHYDGPSATDTQPLTPEPEIPEDETV